MLANCIMYNKSDTDLVQLTKSMKNDVNNIFKLLKKRLNWILNNFIS